jgi:hypothetical protein
MNLAVSIGMPALLGIVGSVYLLQAHENDAGSVAWSIGPMFVAYVLGLLGVRVLRETESRATCALLAVVLIVIGAPAALLASAGLGLVVALIPPLGLGALIGSLW